MFHAIHCLKAHAYFKKVMWLFWLQLKESEHNVTHRTEYKLPMIWKRTEISRSQICQELQMVKVTCFLLNLNLTVSYYKMNLHNASYEERVHTRCWKMMQCCRLCDYHKRKGKVAPTHVMTSFRDSIAFSSVILSGLSSDVCFFMSEMVEERKRKFGKKVDRRDRRWESCRERRAGKEQREREITDRGRER